MKKRILLLFLSVAVMLSGCGGSAAPTEEERFLGESIEDHVLFPDSIEGFVGDTMPFYDNGKFNVFYLADQRAGTQGYHPWALIQTENFTEYEDQGVVIPYGDDIKDQDIALGTGSVIKDADGVYHAFYTGHNDTYSPKEAVMHATSLDLISWTKFPEDTFTGNENYSVDDFRDPYVLYVEEDACYWMLIATRHNNDGVIAKYTSTDLKTWSDGGVFFTEDLGSGTNLECPTLLKFENNWYLSFSDQWPSREVHYRMSDSPKGTFVKPENDIFDGNGFYAGRMETDGKRLFVVGWNPTKDEHLDENAYNWAGNMVTHELKANADGTLSPVVNEDVRNLLSNEIALAPVEMTKGINNSKQTYEFSGEQYEVVVFKELLGSYKLETEIKDFSDSEAFGLAFNMNSENVGNVSIEFNPTEGKIQFMNTTDLVAGAPQSEIDFNFDTDAIKLTVFIADGLVTVYVNDEVAFTTRMYLSQGMDWGIFGINSQAKWENFRLFK